MKSFLRVTPFFWLALLLVIIAVFYLPVLTQGKLPLPTDTIVGMYHPMRDYYASQYPNGIPFKNFLITDSVRQQYPWRQLAINEIKNGHLPLWNPYTHAGTPLLATFQAAVFYPLNLIFFILDFSNAWSLLVILQSILGSFFMYFFLKSLRLDDQAAVLGSLAWIFSGFFIAWLEWNTVVHVALWTPLSLLALNHLTGKTSKRNWPWWLVLLFSLISQFFAGYPQPWLYLFILTTAYFIYRLFSFSRSQSPSRLPRLRLISQFSLVISLFVVITAVQWFPTIKFINLSNRQFDQGDVLTKSDWFLPYQNLVQFIAPDFFGNPATLNYWGIFNYQEFVGYLGLIPLIFIFLAIFRVRRGAGQFFFLVLLLSFMFILKNPLSLLPYQYSLPFLSSGQPSRLLVVIDFALAVLAAIGFDCWLKQKLSLKIPLFLIASLLLLFWLFSFQIRFLFPHLESLDLSVNLSVSRRNLILPTLLFLTFTSLFILIRKIFPPKSTRLLSLLIIGLTIFDLLRFARKYTPFSLQEYLYPPTQAITFLQQNLDHYRYLTLDRRVLPPNFSIVYELGTLEGYDPLYLQSYGQVIASAESRQPQLTPPQFYRIIRPQNYQSPVYDILGVKYFLSLNPINHPKLALVFEEGETKIYQNQQVFPRVFLIPFRQNQSLPQLKDLFQLTSDQLIGQAKIINYQSNQVTLKAITDQPSLLVLTDNYYPNWQAFLDGQTVPVIKVFHTLRGTIIPKGEHEVIYRYSQL